MHANSIKGVSDCMKRIYWRKPRSNEVTQAAVNKEVKVT